MLIRICFYLFFSNLIAQDLPIIDECTGCFSSIGIRDFVLGTEKDDINQNLLKIVDNIEVVDSYYFNELLHNNGKEYKITYYLNFSDNCLIDYHFKISCSKELFPLLLEKLSYESLGCYIDFVNSKKKYSFFSVNKYCERYLMYYRMNKDEQYIQGGARR